MNDDAVCQAKRLAGKPRSYGMRHGLALLAMNANAVCQAERLAGKPRSYGCSTDWPL